MSSTEFRADTRDMKFILHEVLNIKDSLLKREQFKDLEVDDVNMIIDEAAKFAETVLAPVNKEGDKEGCKFEDGKVTVPKCYHKLYEQYCENGWNATTVSPEYDGQGLPTLIASPVGEMFTGANSSFMIYPGLTIGIGRLIESFGTDWMKEHYMKKMYAGEWGGTMQLTEPNAGSAVGDITTSAKKVGDHYLLTGTKMFISGGDHDLTPNIIHAVLGRVEGAPEGVKGISLFAVPKIMVNEDGSLGEPNDVACGGIEKKIGLHGSCTCIVNLGENSNCVGYLLGEENKGLEGMFQMMNEARIGTGLQGVALAGPAYLNSLSYAKERVQGVAIETMKDPKAPRVEIIKHPDVRRMLMMQKAYVEGCRMLLYYASFHYDMMETAVDKEEHDKYNDLLELITPVCKAYPTDYAFRCCETAIQVLGGYGCSEEYPIEQYLRDVKIGSIYEGTNGIQALDLLGRKVGMKKGKLFMNFVGILTAFVEKHKDNEGLKDLVAKLDAAKDKLVEITMHLGGLGMSGDALYPVLSATPYLHLFGDVLVAYCLLMEAVVAQEKLAGTSDTDPDKKFYSGKIMVAKFFINNILPQINSIAEAIMNGDRSALEIDEEAF